MNKKLKLFVLITLCVVLVGIFAVCAFKIASTLIGYKQAEKSYDDLANQYVTVAASPSPAPTAGPSESAAPVEEEHVGGNGFNPDVSPINVDFDGLLRQDSDYAAWIFNPTTVINYPVAYTDNNDYYLDHNITDGSYNASGTLFMDCRGKSDFSDMNTIIYGHNMKNGSMFASLHSYGEEGYYEAHPFMFISTPDKDYRLDLIAAFVTEPTSFAYIRNFDSDVQFLGYIENIKSLSDFDSDVEVEADDHVVSLSTCTYEVDDGRYVVVGKLVELES